MKKGKAGVEKEVTKETTCSEELIEFHPMPEELDYFNIWEPQVIKAFLTGQDQYALREGFLIDMQRVFTALRTKIDDLERQIKDVKELKK